MFQPIGKIKSPFNELKNMPVQPKGAKNIQGTVKIDKAYRAGLSDLDGFSHIYLIYHLHEVIETKLKLIPFMDDFERGVFSTRSPARPNRIGMSVVELVSVDVDAGELIIDGVDVLDGTPLFDIKPYIEHFDRVFESRSGWMTKSANEVAARRSDDRFIE